MQRIIQSLAKCQKPIINIIIQKAGAFAPAFFVAEKSEPEKKSIIVAFKELVDRIIKSIKKALSRGNLTPYQQEYLEMEQNLAKDIRAQFLNALDAAADNYKSSSVETETEQKNNTADNSSVKNSLNVEFDETYNFENNIKTVSNMKPVSELSGNEFAKSDVDLITQVTKYFNSIGNFVETKYGNVILNRTGIKSSIAHGIGRNKAAAFKAVPDVLKNGDIIDYQNDYKNRGYDTAVFAAPITINNSPYYTAVVSSSKSTCSDIT